jgi:osmotically-inducible protein OsmY
MSLLSRRAPATRRVCRRRDRSGRHHHDQTVSRQIDENEIHAAVKTLLTTARFSNIVNIDINVTNGVVTLAGEVPNAAVKADAVAEARAVKGVVRVHDELQVKAPPTS